MDIALTDREADVMQILWERGPSVVAEVRDHLADELAYTTVLTILRTLEAKGYVAHEEEGEQPLSRLVLIWGTASQDLFKHGAIFFSSFSQFLCSA